MVDIQRDQYGRPLLPHPTTRKRRPWTRATTLASTIQDRRALEAWSQRNLVKGFVANEDLLVRAAAAGEDRGQLDTVIGAAQQAARASAAADKGTAVHALTEKIDRGEDVTIPRDYQADIDAYTTALRDAGIKMIPEFIETMTINVDVESAGTPDRIVTCPQSDRPVIFDLKGLALDTPLPTPAGWTTMGIVEVGDQLLDSRGNPCTVTATSRIHQRACRRLRFDDTFSIVCDDAHRWVTRIGPRGRDSDVRTTAQIAARLRNPSTGQCDHRIPIAAPLDLPDADLPIDPYVLGLWLGDGKHTSGEVCKPDQGVWDEVALRGWKISADHSRNSNRARSHTIYGLRRELRHAGLLGNKHIPAVYMRASITQRLDLLRGLMDSDGTWNRTRRRAVFSSTDKAMSASVHELALTLGERATVHHVEGRGFGKAVTSYPVEWRPARFNPFASSTKATRVEMAPTSSTTVARRRLIMSAEPTITVPTRCVQVDSPDHTYLAGEHMVPTHNTGANAIKYGLVEIAAQLAIYAGASHYYDGKLHQLPDLEQRFGIVLHLPAGSGEATLHRIDLAKGRQIAQLCHQVRAARKLDRLAAPLNAPYTDAGVRRRVTLIKAALDGGPLPHPWPDGIPTPSRHDDEYDANEAAAIGIWCVFVEDELNLVPF